MILELRNICKTYNQGKLDVPVLNNVSLSVEEGEYLAIMGPSGSGKTTLMNIIGCLDTPTSGEYYLEGVELSEKSDKVLSQVRLRSLGFVFQSFNLLSRQSAVENVALPLLYAGVRKSERTEIAKRALERVGLGDRLEFKPTQLSGGQCQRVAIARAIVNNPKILLADEPTGALDTKSGEQIMEVFQKLNDEGVTVVMITHEQEIAAHARRILHIRDGQLVDAPAVSPVQRPADLETGPFQVHYGEKQFDDISSARPKVVLPIEVGRPFEKKEDDGVLDIEAAAELALEQDLWGENAGQYAEEYSEPEEISIEDIPVLIDEEPEDEPVYEAELAAEPVADDKPELEEPEIEEEPQVEAAPEVSVAVEAVEAELAAEPVQAESAAVEPVVEPVIEAPVQTAPVVTAPVNTVPVEKSSAEPVDIEDIALETEVFFDDEIAALLDDGQAATYESGDRFLRRFGLDPKEDRGEPPAMVTRATKSGAAEQMAFDIWSGPSGPEPTGDEIVKLESDEPAETPKTEEPPAEKQAKKPKKTAAPKKPKAEEKAEPKKEKAEPKTEKPKTEKSKVEKPKAESEAKKAPAAKKTAAPKKTTAPEEPAIPAGQFGAPKKTDVDLTDIFSAKKPEAPKAEKAARTAKSAKAKAEGPKAEKPAKSSGKGGKTGSAKLVEIPDLSLTAGDPSGKGDDK